MVPKIEFVYSWIYFESLNKHLRKDISWKKVKEIGKKFEDKYSEEIAKIVEVTPEVTNKEWKDEIIKVYLVEWAGPSFSHPLTLKVREDLLLMLVVLTHELIHNILDEKASKETERKINDYIEKIFEKVGIEGKEQISLLRKISEVEIPKEYS